jgi:putative ABC transport system permease protein
MNNPFNHKQIKLSFFGITVSGFVDALRMALESLRANKMRSILTLLGIIIGVMTVVGMLSVIEGLNQSMARQIGALGSNVIYISKFPPVRFGPPDPSLRNRPDIEIEYASLIEEMCPAVLSASPEKYRYGRVKSGSKDSASVQIAGGGENYFVVNNYELSGGRGLTQQDVVAASDVCVLAYEVADMLFPVEDPLGKDITIQGRRFTVVGVLEQKGQMLGQSMDNFVLIPYTVFNKLFGNSRSENIIAVQARSKEDLPAAIDQVEELLRRKRNVAPNAPDNFEIITQDSLMSIYNQVTGAAFAVMIGVAGISLLVGGIGIMNIMLVSVTERTREIGIRKAVGARRRAILLQFLTEGVTLSVSGGTVGIIVGVLIALIVASAVHLPRAIPLWSVALGFFFSAAVGIFFGWYPAYKASKLDPIQALHYE